METQDYLNLFAGTTSLRDQDALNVLAGTTGRSKQDCWNILAGTSGLSSQAAANVWAGTPSPSYLSIRDCCEKMYLSGGWVRLNNVYPTLSYNFSNNRYFTKTASYDTFPFSSVRTTNAMMFDASGNMVFAPVQLCTRGNDLTNWASLGTDGNVVLSGNTSPTGAPSYTVTWTAASPGTGFSIGGQPCLTGSSLMTYSVYLRYINTRWARVMIYSGSNSSNQCRCWVDLQNKTLGTISSGGTASGTTASIQDVGNGWVRVIISGNASLANTADANILVTSATGDGNAVRVGNGAAIEIASAILEPYSAASPQTWRSEFATVGSAWYGPRFDYYPVIIGSSTVPGLLSEESRTNLVTKSLNLISTDITNGAATSANSPSTYLGRWSSARVTYDGTSALHYGALGPITPSGSTAISLSAIIKPITGTLFQLTVSGNWGDVNTYANFSLTGAGSVVGTGSAASEAFCHHLGNGIYHIGVSGTTIAVPASGASCIVGAITAAGDFRLPTNTSTNSFDFIFGGAYQAAGWCMPVPTFGTSSTRNGDTFTTTLGSWFDTTKGTLFAKFMRGFVASGTGTARAFMQIDLDTNNRVVLTSGVSTNSQHRFDVLSGGVSQAQIQTSTGASSYTTREVAGLYNTNNFKASENNSAGTDDATGSVPTGLTSLRVAGWGATNQIMGWMFEVKYYPDASASSAQLNALTS